MVDDIRAVKINIFHQRAAIFAIENDMLMLAGRAASLDYYAQCIGRPHRRMRDIGRDKEGLTFVHDMIDDSIPFAHAYFDVALQLVEVLLRVHQMKIVPRVWPFYDHDEKIAPVVKIAVAYRWFEVFPVLFKLIGGCTVVITRSVFPVAWTVKRISLGFTG